MEDNPAVYIAIDSIVLFSENRTVQEYFKFNITVFFELVSEVFVTLNNSEQQKYFFNKNIFHKNLMACENFTTYFLEILIPQFGKILLKSDEFFLQFSQITQKVNIINIFEYYFIIFCFFAVYFLQQQKIFQHIHDLFF